MGKSIFIDAEWFLSQKIYLIGYAYNLQGTFQLHDKTINEWSFNGILRDVDVIYCYGPDVGMLEKFFDCDLKTYYWCFNLLTIIKRLEPDLPSYKLADLEKIVGIQRETMEYKSNIWQLHRDWKNPLKKQFALKYNREDVENLIRVKNYFFQKHGITRKDIEKYRL
ncbi:MAG: ribonuclease H-like domain-containing protein [Paludibacter sp.]